MGLLTQEFEIERGVIQGSRLGPILFNIFFTTIINKISNLPGAQFSFGLKISILTYADDIILLASSWASMQRLVNACFIHSEDNGYVYAPGKCKIIVLHINYEKLNPIFLGDVALEYVRQYKYLGVDFEQRFLNFSAYLNATIQKTRLRSISLSQIGIQKDGLRALTARNIFGTLVRPLIEYAAQVMDFNKKVTRELEKIQMKFFPCLRRFWRVFSEPAVSRSVTIIFLMLIRCLALPCRRRRRPSENELVKVSRVVGVHVAVPGAMWPSAYRMLRSPESSKAEC